METIVLGGGCFWCLEAIYTELKGVDTATSGYAGGTTSNPSYEEVCTGRTGHAEVVKVTFDPDVISLHDILMIFFTFHDPTTLNRQGADIGTEYRSLILYTDPAQREVIQRTMEEVDGLGIWEDPLVTEVAPLEKFYEAEEYQQQYFAKHGNQAYCAIMIAPKVSKLRREYRDKLKK